VRSYRQQFGHRWISAMPTNLYGPGDNFDLDSGHVLPAMIRRFHEADDRVTLWGTGQPRREFLHSDDAASAILHLVEHYNADEHVNVGTGRDISIRQLAELVADVVGFEGDVEWDTSKPDGTPRKLLDVSRLRASGWRAHVGLREGIEATYAWFTTARQPRDPTSP